MANSSLLSPSTLLASLLPLSFPGEDTVVAKRRKVGIGSNVKEPQSVLTAYLEENQWSLMRLSFLHNELGWDLYGGEISG